MIEFTLGDNGVGIPAHIDPKNTETLGLQLITILVEDQLEGTLTIERDEGSRFIIVFREDEER